MAETESLSAPPSWAVARALALAGFSEHEQVILQAVRESSRGTPARLDIPALARTLGVPFQRLYAARARLLRAWVLVAAADGGLLLNPAAHEWIRLDHRTGRPVPGPDGKPLPRLSPPKLAYAAAARALQDAMTTPSGFTPAREDHSRATVNPDSRATVNPDSRATVNEDGPSRPDVNPDSRATVNGIHAQPLIAFTDGREGPSRAGVNPPVEDRPRGARPRGIDFLDFDLDLINPPIPPQGGGAGRGGVDAPPQGRGGESATPEAIASVQAPDPPEAPRAAVAASAETDPGPGIRSPEAGALAAWAEALGGNWAYWARGKCASYPATWIKVLLQRRVEGIVPQPREPYLNAILQRWKAEGGCEYLRARPSVPFKASAAPEPRSAAYEYVRPEPPVPPEEAARRRAALEEFMGRFKAPMSAPDAARARRRDLA